jgi:hypothetical protein
MLPLKFRVIQFSIPIIYPPIITRHKSMQMSFCVQCPLQTLLYFNFYSLLCFSGKIHKVVLIGPLNNIKQDIQCSWPNVMVKVITAQLYLNMSSEQLNNGYEPSLPTLDFGMQTYIDQTRINMKRN